MLNEYIGKSGIARCRGQKVLEGFEAASGCSETDDRAGRGMRADVRLVRGEEPLSITEFFHILSHLPHVKK